MKYGFIGCGNMGSALARALSQNTKDIILCDSQMDKAERLSDELGCTCGEIGEVAKNADMIFLGVKPQVMGEVLGGIKDILKQKKPLLITMAAGLSINKILDFAGDTLPVIRIMPNTPVSVGKGVVLYCANSLVKGEVLDSFVDDMQFAGNMEKIEEEQIDAACSVSGCGPAYMYMFIDAIAAAAQKCGISRQKATEYAALTMAGAAEMVLKSSASPIELRDAVCSKGGSTIEGVRALEENGFYTAVEKCITAAFKRNKELGGN